MQPLRAVPTVAVCLLVLALGPPASHAQTVTDGLMMPRGDLCTGFLYDHDRWSDYWEGTLRRDNGNVGSLTTQSVSWVGNYGVTDRVNVIAMVPYVWTGASAGTLRGQNGLQDLTFAIKVNALQFSGAGGSFKVIGVGAVGTPLSDYTPDFYPLSLGSASRRAQGRLTLNYTSKGGFYLNGTSGYTWRDNVRLDRGSYFTDGQLFYTDQVAMPDVFDYSVSVGYSSGRLELPLSYSQMITRGGSDIRRQDMPFVSNKMDMSRLDVAALYYLPGLDNLAIRLAAARTLRGRNVGRSTTVQAGFLYVFHF
jgi:hypothetical protein